MLERLNNKANQTSSRTVNGPETVTEKRISPRRSLLLGRHVSFAIDDTSIQMAVASHVGTRVKVVHAAKEYLPNHNEAPDRHVNALEATVEAYIRDYGGYHPKISFTLTGKDTAFRSFYMPALNGKEMASAIGYEIRNQVPFPPDDCSYDFHCTSIISDGSAQKKKIALYASTRKKILNGLKPFHRPSATVSQIYHCQEVLGHLLHYLPSYNPENTYCLLSITRGYSEISFFEGNELRFFHSGEMGSAFSASGSFDSAGLGFFAESLINEVRTSFDFYSGQFGAGGTPVIYIYGDLSYSDELLALLREGTSYNFQRFPIEELECLGASDEELLFAMTACLPAIAASVCQYQSANLLPAELKRQVLSQRANNIGKLTLGTAAVLLATATFAFNERASRTAEGARQLEQQVTAFEQSEAFHTYNNLKLAISRHRTYMEQAKATPSNIWLGLKDLSRITPAEIKLVNFSYRPQDSGRNIIMQGVASSDQVPPEVIVAEYAQDLEASPLWEDIQVVRHSKKLAKSGAEIEFHIEMKGGS